MNDQTLLTHLIHSNHAGHPHESQTAVSMPSHPAPQDFFAPQFVRCTQSLWELNGLYLALSNMIGHGEAIRQMLKYNLGTSKWNGGSTVFWQLSDSNPNLYSGGLIVKFDPKTGEPQDNYFTTVQDAIADRYNLEIHKPTVPTFIGEHLVALEPSRPVIISHHPITALVGSHYLGQYTWLVTPDHPHVDLTGPSFVTALKTTEPILLIAELGREEQWSRAYQVLKGFLSVHQHRRIALLKPSSCQKFSDSTAAWIADDPDGAGWALGNLITQSNNRNVSPTNLKTYGER